MDAASLARANRHADRGRIVPLVPATRATRRRGIDLGSVFTRRWTRWTTLAQDVRYPLLLF